MTDTRTASAGRPTSTPPGGRTAPGRSGGRARRAPTGSWPVREQSLIKPVLGVPPTAAVAIAAGFTALGVLADLLRIGTVGAIFEVGYFLGCVLAVAWVRRRSIFVPSIQPPLLLAVVVPVIAVLIGAPAPEAGATEHLLMAGAPLINAFPAMAVTTVAVLLLAGFRLMRQRTGDDDAVGLLRRRFAGGQGSAPKAGRERTTPRGTAGSDRKRPDPAVRGSGERRSGERGSDDRARRRTAPETGSRTTGSRTGDARATGARTASAREGRPAPRAGTGRSATGSTRADDPARSRRPRRS